MKKSKTKKRKKMIKPKIQTGFCIVSIIFILGCCIFYGSRLVKYYKVFNPKAENGETLMTLANAITSKSQVVYEGEGVYVNNANYIYKGENVNNYVLINNMLFRIMKVNADKTIDVVLDEYINKLPYNKEYIEYNKSSIHEYLNNKVLSIIDEKILEKPILCEVKVDKVNEASCEKYTNDDYVRLLGITDILNSLVDNKTYLVKDSEYLWLYNETESKVWHTNGATLASDTPSERYGIKPVLTLKNNVILISGEGKRENPYKIASGGEEVGVGTYLDINDSLYIIYEVGEDYYKIESDTLLQSRIFDNDTNEYSNSSLKTYLEKDYLDSLSFSKLLKEVDFNGVKSKVGILSDDDFKFNSSLKSYFLSDTLDSNIYLYNGSLVSSRVNVKRNVRPCLGISKDLNIISGNGSKLAPFIVEV